MLNDLGQKIRTIRKMKGIGLNEYAAQLGVSKSYLSNLEIGKTDTVQLNVLEKIQQDLNLLVPTYSKDTFDEEFSFRLNRINSQLLALNKNKPNQAKYLLSVVEQGLELFKIEMEK